MEYIGFLFFLILDLLMVSAVLHMIYQRRTPTSMISWFLAMILFPYVAVLLYFIFGTRKIQQEKSIQNLKDINKIVTNNPIENILKEYNIPPATHKNSVELIFKDYKAFENLIKNIRKSKKYIWISTFIFKYDKTTKIILEELVKKASEGVEVRLLLDTIGSWQIYFYKRRLKKLIEAGGKVEFFMPFFGFRLRNYINLRNHRKIYLFDGESVISGGMNLSDEYMGENDGTKRWKDMVFYLKGEAVYHFAEIFANDWEFTTNEKLTLTQPLEVKDDVYMQVVPSGPDVRGDALFEALINAIFAMKERIWIVTPYFVPDEVLLKALVITKHKGIDVKIITPRKTDTALADIARSSYIREVKEESIDVVFYEGEMLHAKAILFDNVGVMLGSVNLDNRSLLLNYEVASFSYSKEIIEDTENWIKSLMDNSTRELKKASRFRILLENLARIIAPQI